LILLAALAPGLGGCGSDDAAAAETQTPTGPTPKAEFLPRPTGQCPGFADGAGCTSDETSLICTFSPAGIVPRPVRIWMSEEARKKPGPLVSFWHGLTRSASDATFTLGGLGQAVVDDIVAKGGIVASAERSEKRMTTSLTELPWLLALGTGDEDDLLVLDEVVGCAIEEVGIDTRRIHTSGMSAGGLQTGQVNARRSGYLASTAVFSGGQLGEPAIQDPDNKLPVILFHGGPNDVVVLKFSELQTVYHQRLKDQGHFALLCDHAANHTVPAPVAQAAWDFMQDHPFGVKPEPYANGLPATMPSFCVP
jgi:predicted esterase